jgi:2-hydroxy-3-keto-5-methylthiopentenyl-1-phosphate phosphatase
MSKIFFIDFDGTITLKDTCAAMVEAFAKDGWEEINRLWEDKKLSTEDCANMTFHLMNAGIDDIRKLMETIEIDPYFKEFLSIIRNSGYKAYVLSDGYDFNIETVFLKYNIDVPYYSNKLLYDNGFHIECPHSNKACGNCGTCKSRLMDWLKENGDQVIYIGDGYSDTCPAEKADMVFAKGTLYKYCIDKGLNVIHYNNFKDILDSQLFLITS